VNRDIVEAYKWAKLVSRNGFQDMNRFVLGMTHDQIQEGEKRAREWAPHQTTDEELLEVIYLREIVLKAIAGTAGRRMAIINGQPLGKGDEAKVKAGQKTVSARCLEVKERSAFVLIEGIRQPKELSLR
jgi:sRNA-binding protein